MMMNKINRRDFLKLSALGLSAAALGKIYSAGAYLPEFPQAQRLGRTFYTVAIKTKPDPDSSTVKTVYNDAILVIDREVIGKPYTSYWKKRTWYETPEGFIPSISVQPVRNEPNAPLADLPVYGSAPGMWAEVTVPYVDIYLDGKEAKSPRLQETVDPRFYYSQVVWIDDVIPDTNNEVLYHVTEKHGSYGDVFWADARAFHPITPEEIAPISPETSEKYIVVDVNHQTLSCFENGQEILFTRVSTGAKYNSEGQLVDKWATPAGDYHLVSRKYISLHMAGGDTKASGYEEFAVSWNSIFATGGVAIHGTYWHNNYGEMLSHGCVNVEPEVAKFIYRWTLPDAPYYEGVLEIQDYSGTNVRVIDRDAG
jgi:lipoprotein-anchoring transpeptidase ErfK/SrfK